jgi:hypothetical protein
MPSAYEIAIAAEERFTAEGRKAFGKRWIDHRYDSREVGWPQSLKDAFQAKVAADNALHEVFASSWHLIGGTK